MANQGITVATYKQKSGLVLQYGIESCVRRDLVTAVVQATNRMSDTFINQMNAKHVIISQHLGARVTGTNDFKDHSWWQGKVFKLEGEDQDFPNFQKSCNEGDIQGFNGVNCRHHKFAYFPGISIPPDPLISEKENKKMYELSQKQRYCESKIRNIKRQIGVAKASSDEENVSKYKDKLKSVSYKYKEFCDKNDLKRDYEREKVYS